MLLRFISPWSEWLSSSKQAEAGEMARWVNKEHLLGKHKGLNSCPQLLAEVFCVSYWSKVGVKMGKLLAASSVTACLKGIWWSLCILSPSKNSNYSSAGENEVGKRIRKFEWQFLRTLKVELLYDQLCLSRSQKHLHPHLLPHFSH